MGQTVLDVMRQHRSHRSFTTEEIPNEKLMQIIEAAQMASTSHHVQAYSIIIVEDKEKREKIAEVAKQSQVTDSPVFLVFCADLKRLEHAAIKHNKTFDYDSAENLLVTTIDTALVAQNVLLAAESLGYGGCYVGGIRNNLETVSEVLQLPDKVFPLFGMTLGVPAIMNERKPRLPIEAVVHTNTYNEEKYPKLLEQYDEEVVRYYRERSNNNKSNSWTELMAQFFSKPRREHIKGFLQSKGFHFK